MEKRKNLYLNMTFIVFVLIFYISGCSLLNSYGKLRQQSRDGLTIQDLSENWNDYSIYYAGYYGSLSIKHPSAVMFDPRNDNKRLVGDKWTMVKDKHTLSELIDSIQRQESVGGFYPRLWRILGPDDQLYGFLFTAWDHVVTKVIDDKMMRMYDLPSPPYLFIDGAEETRYIPVH
jgi:hypothetical protein